MMYATSVFSLTFLTTPTAVARHHIAYTIHFIITLKFSGFS